MSSLAPSGVLGRYIDRCFDEASRIATPIAPAGAVWSDEVKLGCTHAKCVGLLEVIPPDHECIAAAQRAIHHEATGEAVAEAWGKFVMRLATPAPTYPGNAGFKGIVCDDGLSSSGA